MSLVWEGGACPEDWSEDWLQLVGLEENQFSV